MPPPSVRVKVVDHGYEALLKRVTAALSRVTVGVHEEEGSATEEGGPTVAEIGTFHEFGLGVPQRSFIGAWADENEATNRALIRTMAEGVVSGAIPSARAAMDRLGLVFVASVQKRMKDRIKPKLEDSTVAQRKKGPNGESSDIPLIDDGTLWESIRHKVV